MKQLKHCKTNCFVIGDTICCHDCILYGTSSCDDQCRKRPETCEQMEGNNDDEQATARIGEAGQH